ncbi:DUF4123 domain-containing protein [Geomonas nitrogeniifigens]|uniref:DUF4123 domain-containing protein n=1 Tax=Geomonas diazotrophica TaxID=2843197 RepID=UPI001C2C5FA3|nr:DUF4123 domain-containing protein [Geomonas nitrogeniifigens]QXE87783.1 DUF4123 domain-containing protein [Geomonas nitrogeniifigens]
MQRLNELLFSTGHSSVFGILDGAMVPDLPDILSSFAPQYFCLMRGPLQPDLAQVAPYLVYLRRGCPFTDWLLAKGWGRHWGIYGGSNGSMMELRKHFRRLFHVSDETGKAYYFRFYDPSVLRNYLPRCTDEETAEFFGPLEWIVAEENDPGTARKFFLTDTASRDDRRSITWGYQRIGEVSWKSELSK